MTFPDTKSFRSAVDDQGVATITLDRPDRINALTFEVYGELRDTFRHLKEHAPEVRAIVLQGEGPRGFCSGGDVTDINANGKPNPAVIQSDDAPDPSTKHC